jgi:superfamily II DNA or RNA helicase
MVSEGVDIPRLRVGVYATTTTTELFFRQAVGRLVRWTRGIPRQRAWLFVPDDPRLRSHVARMQEQRRHSLARGERELFEREGDAERADPDEQMSLFAVISSVATDAWEPQDDEPWPLADAAEEFELTLAPPPPLAGGAEEAGAVATLTRREEKNALREANADVARELVRRTRLTHAQVNAELNRLSGVRRVAEATIAELERRIARGRRWLAQT